MLMFEVGALADPEHLLARISNARARLEESLMLPASFPGE
jgi:hypothetical protein